jgi:glucose/arabinose dehydrogenase
VFRADETTADASIRVVQVAEGLRHPWGLAFLPDGRWLVAERPGALWLADNEELRPVQGLPDIRAIGQGGLMDVAAHPDFANTLWIYFSYAAEYDGGVGTRVARGRLVDDRLEDLEVIFQMNPPGRGGVHFGSRLAFDGAGYLFITLGERNDRHRAQQWDSHHGKVVRLHDDGRIPADNPFVNRAGALPEIWSYGHRNPQGLYFDLETGTLWAHEHGPQGGDTLNRIRPGRNYGWPVATYGEEYGGGRIGTVPETRPDIENPLVVWRPRSIAPSGLTRYRNGRIAAWEGDLFVGALIGQHLRRLKMRGDAVVGDEVLLQNRVGRIRTVVTGPDGDLWLTIDSANGHVLRIEPVDERE